MGLERPSLNVPGRVGVTRYAFDTLAATCRTGRTNTRADANVGD